MQASFAAFLTLACTLAATVRSARIDPRAAATTTSSVPYPTPAGTTSQCSQYYLVESGNTCSTITAKTGVSLPEFLSLNPEVNSGCTNLLAGYYYCVAPSSAPTTTSTSSSSASTSTVPGPVTTAPPNTAPGTPTGDKNKCDLYATVQSGDTCGAFSLRNNLSQGLMVSLNPEINANCSNLLANEAYCVGVPYIGPCTQFYTVVSGDTCTAIYSNFTISSTNFQTLNPDTGDSCLIRVGQSYCVAATVSPKPTSTSTSATSTSSKSSTKKSSTSTSTKRSSTSSSKKPTASASCSKQVTVKSGQTCTSIEKKYDLTSKQFLALNPKIKCSSIKTGDKVCVKK